MKIEAGNYLDRATGAVYVSVAGAKMFFFTSRIIAISKGGVFYRGKTPEGGIIYRRIREALLKSEAKRTVEVSMAELNELASQIILEAATTEVSNQFTGGNDV